MTATGYTHGTFCWNELATSDLPAAAGYYRSLLGWTTVETPMPGGGGTYVLCQVEGGDVAGMYELSGPQFAGVPPHWASYVWVDDVAAAVRRSGELGGEVVAPLMDVPGVGHVAFVKDPAGAHLGLFHGREHKGAARFEGTKEAAFYWNECVSRDVARAKPFYQALLGWTSRDMDMGGRTYTVFQSGETPVCGLMEMPPLAAEVPSHWMAYVTVGDCDGSAREAEKLGGRVVHPPTDVPGVGRFAVLQDPQGAVLSVMKPR